MTVATNPLTSPDVFSMTDEALAKMYQFSEETGVGNWGSVWLGNDKRTIPSSQPKKVAIKVVHRTKTQTAAAQVRSLWNEMKVVRTFKEEPHPSIIVFESFIITPSYAIIVMPFLPKLLPVDIEEEQAKPWLAALSSAVCFLHARGVVHNDIKPANILLSSTSIPTLVDFGFSEKYEPDSPDAFRTTLAYGTPEYLSPERAKGLTHDPRKSDIWSLGVTFFEILMGRTPFEKDGGEHFSTKEELDVYWSRTMKGKWVGAERVKKQMSRALESLLRRMLEPNADVRIKSWELLNDLYWHDSFEIGAGTGCQETKSASRSILGNKLNTLLPSQPMKANDNRSARTLKKKDAMTLRETSSGNKENVQPSSRTQAVRTPEIVVTQSDSCHVSHKMKSQSVSSLRKHNLSPLKVPTGSYGRSITVQEYRNDSSSPTLTTTPSSVGSSANSPQVLQKTSTRVRADRIFSNSPNGSTQPIGNAVSIGDANQESPEPFEASPRMARHERWMQENNAREIRRIKSDLTARSAKGPLSRRHSEDQLAADANSTKRGHARAESHNSMYRRVPPIPVIPEAGSEDADVIDLSNPDATAIQDIEKLYDEFLVGTNAVKRLGKGYQSNICTQNDPATFQKLSKKASQLLSVQNIPNSPSAVATLNPQNVQNVQTHPAVQDIGAVHGVSQTQHIQITEKNPKVHHAPNTQKGHKHPHDKADKKSRSEIKRQTSTNFFLSMRESHFARRKVRAAASFDGFRRPRSPPSATRPASAYLADFENVMDVGAANLASTLPTMDTMHLLPATNAMNATDATNSKNLVPFTNTTNATNSKEKKRSTMTGAFRKAFYSLLGSEKTSK